MKGKTGTRQANLLTIDSTHSFPDFAPMIDFSFQPCVAVSQFFRRPVLTGTSEISSFWYHASTVGCIGTGKTL
jgi:hypothetical protein